MVNLVVRHGSVSSPVMKSPTSIANRISKLAPSKGASSERIVPSPIRVPFARNQNGTHRPVSPLTASDSMFGLMQDRPIEVPGLSTDSTVEERQQPSETSVNSTSELTCDYDQSITPLYEMLESSQWEQAQIRCRTHPQEVHTWIARRDTDNNIRWKLLPLHAAVIFKAPSSVIEGLLDVYPIAAAKRDDQGMLPLHLTFRHKADETVIEKLIRQYPGGIVVQDRKGRVPLDHAKDSKFSFSVLRLYAETYSKYNHGDEGENNARDVSSNRNGAVHEARLSTIKEAYEARIKAMARDHEQNIQELKSQREREAQATQSIHNAEMDELRDLLSREVSSGKKVSQLEADMGRLAESLAVATQEGNMLREVVHEQKRQQEALTNQLHQILHDHKSLHDLCLQQKERLDQAHQVREQLLRTLLQKDDGKDVRASDEVCQLSKKLVTRTESLFEDLSRFQLEAEEDTRKVALHVSTGITAPTKTTKNLAEAAPTAWGPMGDHGDDISAITENSHF